MTYFFKTTFSPLIQAKFPSFISMASSKKQNVLDQITGKWEDKLNGEIFRNEVLKGFHTIRKTPK